MKEAVIALLSSRKFLVVNLACLTGAAFVLAGKLDVDHLTAYVSGLSAVLIASIAYEDGQEKRAGGSPEIPTPPAITADPRATPRESPAARRAPLAGSPFSSIFALTALVLSLGGAFACSALGPAAVKSIATTVDAIACKELASAGADPAIVTVLCPSDDGSTKVQVRMARADWNHARARAAGIDAGPGL